MNTILLGKLFAVVGSIAVPVVGYVLLDQYFNKDQGPYVYVVVESGTGTAATSNFKCKLEGSTTNPAPFECKVEQLNWENKKHLDYSSGTSKEVATAESLKVEHNVFKITIPKENNDAVKNTDKKIEIFNKTGNAKYVDAKILFTVDKDGKKFGSTKLFVGKASESSTSNSLIDSYTCSWDDAVTNDKKCQVFDFADPSTQPNSNEPFSKTDKVANVIAVNNLYLIDWKSEKFQVQAEGKQKQLSIFYKPTTSNETTIKFTDIKPSFLIGEKLLILEANK